GADRAGLAVVAVGTVGGTDAVEAVTLHDAGEALALAGAGDVDLFTVGEGVDTELLADRVGRGVSGADLDQVATRGHTGLGEVTGHRLVDLACLDLAEADLDGVVAIGLGLADLSHAVGRRVCRCQPPGTVALDRARVRSPCLPSMAGPGGGASRDGRSAVFRAGPVMSVSRVGVGMARCSRGALYVGGERIAQYAFFS